jgi:hypothetical protein
MRAALKRICELQPSYSAEKTPEMQERGVLIRSTLRLAVADLQPQLVKALGRFGDTFAVGASDGIGRKTELPWVRFCSEEMSPSPTEGFYSVFHFSTDGSAVHLTIGCGSSKWQNGSSVPLPDKELDAQTSWARSIVREKFGTLAPFTDSSDFGATRALPVSFQRATAISKRIAYGDIDSTDFEALLTQAGERLQAIYEAQAEGRDVSQADQAELEISEVLKGKSQGRQRQGYGLPAAARRQVELRAMVLSQTHLESLGYSVKDCSANQSYDIHAERDGKVLKVEVKGTTSDRADAILMTSNEVALHRKERGSTVLIIVSKVRLTPLPDGKYSADGGVLEMLEAWDIDEWEIEPTAFRLTRSQ